MSKLPVIVGMGGINPAGRSSSHFAYRRLVIDRLPGAARRETLTNLAVLMGLAESRDGQWRDGAGQPLDLDAFLGLNGQSILDGTLIRKLEDNLFDPEHLRMHQRIALNAADDSGRLRFNIPRRNLPPHPPANWQVLDGPDIHTATVLVDGDLSVLMEDSFSSPVKVAGQLPSGFAPDRHYPSRNHPRGLQMTVYGASDALHSLGIDWDEVCRRVAPDQISVYAGSSMSQLDYNGNGGMLQARLLGKKVTSKKLPLGFAEMPADFINAYLLGNIGRTGANLGACASFHYNLAQAVQDIQSGRSRVVIVGGSEAPLLPEIIEGYANMNALADDAKLLALDSERKLSEPDYRRACRPFAENVGFTLGESAQFFVLFDDALALELGANIHGAVNEVFINADGYKKSIASPGIGNYVTMAKAAAATRAVIGEQGLRHKTFIQAHGTSTPQNRVTESAIFQDVARHFGIENWPITAIKAYVGHSLCCAGADQLALSLGVWQHGIIPGITTSEAIADDVSHDGLDYLLKHREVDTDALEAVLLNAKGFGGNNATASVLSPAVTRRMLARRHGQKAMQQYERRHEAVAEDSAAFARRTCETEVPPTYRFDHDVKGSEDLNFKDQGLSVRGYPAAIDLDLKSSYGDMGE